MMAGAARWTVASVRSTARRRERTMARRHELKAPTASSRACGPPRLLHGDWKAAAEWVHDGGAARFSGGSAGLYRAVRSIAARFIGRRLFLGVRVHGQWCA
jgi:hypothetical protein